MPASLPPYVLPQTSHPAQRMLDLLDAGMVLTFNTKVRRHEVWRKTLMEDGPFYGFIIGLEQGSEPGEWLLNKLRERDSRHNSVKDAANKVLDEIRAGEQAELDSEERKLTELNEEVAKDYIGLWKRKADPHHTTVELKDWDPVPVQVPTAKGE